MIKHAVRISLWVASILIGGLLIIALFVPVSALKTLFHQGPTDADMPVIATNAVNQGSSTSSTSANSESTDSAASQPDAVNDANAADTALNASATIQSQSNTNTSTTRPVTSPGTSSTPVPIVSITKPTVKLSLNQSSILQGNSATLSWSTTDNPYDCAAGGGWSGTKPTSGVQSVAPSKTTSYALACSNTGGSDTKTVTLTVTKPPVCGQAGATCHKSDISSHDTSDDCWSAINADGSGLATYKLTANFLTLHQSEKSIKSKLCGQVWTGNLENKTSKHHNGTKLGGADYKTWMNNFYLGPYE